jgi:hydrogenase/urease accessory protein HupE
MSSTTVQTRAMAIVAALAVPSAAIAHGGDAAHAHGAWQAFAAGFSHPFTRL